MGRRLGTPISGNLANCTGYPSSAFSGQIVFPATQNPSANANTLDDYEEGTWTPVLTFATPGDLSVAYSFRGGFYTKLGRLVCASFAITTSTFTHTTASGSMLITGLPFTSINDANYLSFSPFLFQGINKALYTTVAGYLQSNSTQMLIALSGMGQAIVAAVPADAPSGGTLVLGGTINFVV